MNLRNQGPLAPGRAKVLFVDDEENVLMAFQRNLGRRFAMETALGGREGLGAMQARGPFAVVVADMRMPGMNGVEFLRQARVLAPDTVRIMLTGNADLRTAQDALNEGNIFLFLTKPCAMEDLVEALENAIRQHEIVTAEKELLERTLAESVQLLVDTLGMLQGPAFARTGPTAELALRIARELGAADAWEIRVAAMLASVGIVTLPPELVERFESGETLSPEEQDLLQRLPEISAGILGCIPRLENITQIVLYQGQYYDGSGFPDDGIRGPALPLGARILVAASAFTALQSAYDSPEAALEEMRQQEGCFDPGVLAALVQVVGRDLREASAPPSPTGLADLEPMDLLAEPVSTRDGEQLAPAGVRVSRALLERLGHHHRLQGLREPILVYRAAKP
jgi:response regulator RpfG family c-di-GMP phosphodiesterase